MKIKKRLCLSRETILTLSQPVTANSAAGCPPSIGCPISTNCNLTDVTCVLACQSGQPACATGGCGGGGGGSGGGCTGGPPSDRLCTIQTQVEP